MNKKVKFGKCKDCLIENVELIDSTLACKDCYKRRQNDYYHKNKDGKIRNRFKAIIKEDYHYAKIKLDNGNIILTKNGVVNYNDVISLLKDGFEFILVDNWRDILNNIKGIQN